MAPQAVVEVGYRNLWLYSKEGGKALVQNAYPQSIFFEVTKAIRRALDQLHFSMKAFCDAVIRVKWSILATSSMQNPASQLTTSPQGFLFFFGRKTKAALVGIPAFAWYAHFFLGAL